MIRIMIMIIAIMRIFEPIHVQMARIFPPVPGEGAKQHAMFDRQGTM